MLKTFSICTIFVEFPTVTTAQIEVCKSPVLKWTLVQLLHHIDTCTTTVLSRPLLCYILNCQSDPCCSHAVRKSDEHSKTPFWFANKKNFIC